jgi:Na+/H+-dicarboxylate symporter
VLFYRLHSRRNLNWLKNIFKLLQIYKRWVTYCAWHFLRKLPYQVWWKLQNLLLAFREPAVLFSCSYGLFFNLDGTCIYLTIQRILHRQLIRLSFTTATDLLLTCCLLPCAAGVTGSGFIVLSKQHLLQ